MRLRLEDAAGSGHIASAKTSLIFGGLQVERGQPGVRVIQVDLLRQNARPLDLGHDRHALQRSLDQIGEVVKLPIRVAIAGNFGDAFLGGLGIANDDGAPRIRDESRDSWSRLSTNC